MPLAESTLTKLEDRLRDDQQRLEGQNKTSGLEEQQISLLRDINAAIASLRNGTYGQCVDCLEEGKTAKQATIPYERLKIVPHAQRCVAHQERFDAISGKERPSQELRWADVVRSTDDEVNATSLGTGKVGARD